MWLSAYSYYPPSQVFPSLVGTSQLHKMLNWAHLVSLILYAISLTFQVYNTTFVFKYCIYF